MLFRDEQDISIMLDVYQRRNVLERKYHLDGNIVDTFDNIRRMDFVNDYYRIILHDVDNVYIYNPMTTQIQNMYDVANSN